MRRTKEWVKQMATLRAAVTGLTVEIVDKRLRFPPVSPGGLPRPRTRQYSPQPANVVYQRQSSLYFATRGVINKSILETRA